MYAHILDIINCLNNRMMRAIVHFVWMTYLCRALLSTTANQIGRLFEVPNPSTWPLPVSALYLSAHCHPGPSIHLQASALFPHHSL